MRWTLSCQMRLSMIRKSAKRFSDKIMLHQKGADDWQGGGR
jgi:hypothetical protein